jgi:hypothetical protein
LNHENVLDIVGNVAAPAGEGNFIRVCCTFMLVLLRQTVSEFSSVVRPLDLCKLDAFTSFVWFPLVVNSLRALTKVQHILWL